MKKLISILLTILILIITSCNGKISSNGIGNTSDGQESLSESSLIGAWKYEDSYYGKVFVQFEVAGVIKVFFNDEGEVLEVGNWQIQDSKVIVSNCVLFNELIISDFNGNSFKLPPTNYDASSNTKRDFIIVERLLDEAGEPILHYSLFDKEPVADPRYGNPVSNSTSYESNEQDSYSSENTTSSENGNLCSSCNRKFKFRIWEGGQYDSGNCYGGWKDEENSRPGYIKCSGCSGYGLNWNYDGSCPVSSACHVSSCSGGWYQCNSCYGKGYNN